MRTIILTLALAIGTPVLAAPAQPANPAPSAKAAAARCESVAVQRAEQQTPLSGRKLAQEPPANMSLTVLRKVGGCDVPVIVRYDVERTVAK